MIESSKSSLSMLPNHSLYHLYSSFTLPSLSFSLSISFYFSLYPFLSHFHSPSHSSTLTLPSPFSQSFFLSHLVAFNHMNFCLSNYSKIVTSNTRLRQERSFREKLLEDWLNGLKWVRGVRGNSRLRRV